MPTNDYPIYAHAAVGRNIWHVPIGVAFSYVPHFSDFYFSGDVAYRMIKRNFVNASVGFDWILNDRYQVGATWFTMVNPDQVNVVDRAWTVAVSYFFGGDSD